MKKIPTMFERDWAGDKSRVVDKIHPGCEWVAAGEGVATRKIDGTSCLVRGGKLFKRRELRAGETAPEGFEVSDRDEQTGKTIGWLPVGEGPEDKWHREAFGTGEFEDGTFELIGPKIQGNMEKSPVHTLVLHQSSGLLMGGAVPRTFEGLRYLLSDAHVDIEGIVFHHPDGRMAKIKKKDFGVRRGK